MSDDPTEVLQAQIDTLNGQVTTLEGQVTTLTEQLTAIQAQEAVLAETLAAYGIVPLGVPPAPAEPEAPEAPSEETPEQQQAIYMARGVRLMNWLQKKA